MRIVISSGHGMYVRGASGYIDEVDEARRVVNRVADLLIDNGVPTHVFHDNSSTTQSQNLNTIVAAHNKQTRDLDVSVHFNAYETTSKPMGTEVLYVTQEELARAVSEAVSGAMNLPDRGPKYRTDLAFLNGTEEPAILIEVCFVDSSTDAECYEAQFNEVCVAIASSISGIALGDRPPPERPPIEPIPPEAPSGVRFVTRGRCSYFGGPNDMGVAEDEGLAFFSDVEQMPQLFLPMQPTGTDGLARRLNPYVHYVACRWDYDVTPKEMLASGRPALVRSGATGIALTALPADWGPHEDTDRVADLSPSLMLDLGLQTDDQVEVIYPWGTEVLDGHDPDV